MKTKPKSMTTTTIAVVQSKKNLNLDKHKKMGHCYSKNKQRTISHRAEELFEPRPDEPTSKEPIDFKGTVQFVPPFTDGLVIKVYDGDTFTIASKLPYYNDSPMYRINVRLLGIDAPEMKSADENEKEIAHKAQEALSKLILGKKVILKNTQTEKYGRLLADAYCDGIHLNNWMVEQRYALPYDGSAKQTHVNWRSYNQDGFF
jgi:endonuclease YncB( thermonuclease family)